MTALESCLPEKIQKGENGHNEISWSTSIEEKIEIGKGKIIQGTLNDAFETLSLVERVYNNSEI